MTVRHAAILSVFIIAHAATTVSFAQIPPDPVPIYTGNIGGGLAFTNGNTDTRNFNLTGAIVRDPKSRNVIKASASYLRGSQFDILNLDRAAINMRDEYTVSRRTFVFGQLDYVRDQFKEMIFFWAPTAGVGHRIINTDATQLVLDGGAGTVIEKNPGIDSKASGSVTGGQRFQFRVSDSAVFAQSLASIWKTSDFGDSLTNFSAGVTTTLVGKIQLKLEFIDSYKSKPTGVGVKKNDTAFLTTFVVKF